LDEGIADTLVSDGAANDFKQFAMRESVRSFYSTCTHVSAFWSLLVEEVSEIAGPVIQCSAKRSRSALEPGKEKCEIGTNCRQGHRNHGSQVAALEPVPDPLVQLR
jgi:hypothetical protein